MIENLLPKIQTNIELSKRSLASYARSRNSRPTEVLWSFGINFMALLCLIIIFATSTPGGQKNIISPFVTSIQTATSNIFGGTPKTLETFTFVPGSAPSRFNNVDFNGLKFLSFYDTPINADGTLNVESDAHAVFHTPDTEMLFANARQNGAKVLLTLSLTYNPDIAALLDSQNAKQTLYNQTVAEIQETKIDGITLAIEYHGQADPAYKEKFTGFVRDFTNHIHANVPNTTIAIAIPDTADANSIYDIKALSESTDKTMIMAYSFAVPENENNELKAPIYGFNNTDYMSNLAAKQNTFVAAVPSEKLLMERAWYGNGNNFPLYNMDELNAHKDDPSLNTLTTPLSDEAIERIIADVPDEAKASARKNLPYIAKALEKEGILNANVLAYALATIQHETANTFEPIDEFTGRKSARRLGYEGGTDYFGRGFIQLTHLRNYKKIGERIGVGEELVKNPELASQPDVAARVLAAYFKDFDVAKLAAQGDFVGARTLINPDYNGESIAVIAMGFLYALG